MTPLSVVRGFDYAIIGVSGKRHAVRLRSVHQKKPANRGLTRLVWLCRTCFSLLLHSSHHSSPLAKVQTGILCHQVFQWILARQSAVTVDRWSLGGKQLSTSGNQLHTTCYPNQCIICMLCDFYNQHHLCIACVWHALVQI